MEELLQWSRILTNPRADRYGLMMDINSMSWGTLSFLYSNGGRLVEQDAAGQWRCSFDSEAAVEAYHFVARLFLEPYQNKYGKFNNVVYLLSSPIGRDDKYAMFFGYLDQRFFAQYDPSQWGFGAVPKGPTGIRGSEFNSMMTGIYAGLENDVPKRDAAWEYIHFYDGSSKPARSARGSLWKTAMGNTSGRQCWRRQVIPNISTAFPRVGKKPFNSPCKMVYRSRTARIASRSTATRPRRSTRFAPMGPWSGQSNAATPRRRRPGSVKYCRLAPAAATSGCSTS